MPKKQTAAPEKNKKFALDKKISLYVYLAVVIGAVIFRTQQLSSNMNFAEGRYYDDSLVKNYTFMWLAAGFLLIAAVLLLGKSSDKIINSCILINPMRLDYDKVSKKMSAKISIPMFMMAMLLLYDTLSELINVVTANLELSTEDNPVFIFSGVKPIRWFIYLFAITLVITFVSAGANIIKGDGITGGNCFFFGFFPVWQLLRIFEMINEEQIIAIYSEKVYIMLTAMASSVFILNSIRFFSGHEKKHTRIIMCISGYMASVYAAVSAIPRYIVLFTLDYSIREGMNAPETSEIGVIFFTVAIVTVFWSAYQYKEMPKLTLKGVGKRRWAVQTVIKDMESIDENKKP